MLLEMRMKQEKKVIHYYDLCVCQVSEASLNLQSVLSVVQQTVERLCRTKQEVNELQSQQKIKIQQQQEYCRKYQERLFKVLTTLHQRK